MEQLIDFNGVKLVLTTGEHMDEVQNFLDEGDYFISVYPGRLKLIGGRPRGGKIVPLEVPI